MRPKTIAIDVRASEHTGIGRYIRCTFSRIAQTEAGLKFVAIANPGQDLSWLPDRGCIEPFVLKRAIAVYSPLEHLVLPWALRRTRCELAHFPHFNAPARCPVPFAATIHDIIYLRFPGDCFSRLRSVYASALIRRTARTAVHVLTISQHSRHDIENLLRVPREKITIAYCGGWEEGELPEPGPDALAAAQARVPYVLYVGNQSPHKNIAGLAEAVQIARRRHPGLKLIAAGKEGRHFGKLQRELRRRGLESTVQFPGHVSDETLVALYRNAGVVATATLYEGFGLPVLEAFCAGAPVVSSNRSSLPEVAGNAALLANPDDPRAFAEAIETVLGDAALRKQLVQRGRQRARVFTWDQCAQAHLNVYQQLLS